MSNKWIWLYPLALLLYSVYSFVHVDVNLVLSSHSFYWQVQNLFWTFGLEQRLYSTLVFLGLMMGIFGLYFLIVKKLVHEGLSRKATLWLLVSSILALMVSYPALSHDIFNYAFNAKIVLLYGANPHAEVALNFPQDPWLAFMHNVHTPAPYAQGWTALSLIPGFLGQNHIQTTMLLFRAMMIGWLALLIWMQLKLTDKAQRAWVWVFALNPLILIETVSNIHNDVVMMALLLWSVYLFKVARHKEDKLYVVLGIIVFLLSVSIKYASVMFLVGLIVYEGIKFLNRRISWGGAQMFALFLPLLSQRSQRFLPWYLIWSLSFLPMTKEAWIRNVGLAFSLTGLLSYIPFLFWGEYNDQILLYRSLILFSLPCFYLVYELIRRFSNTRSAKA